MAEQQLSREEQLVAFIVNRCKGRVGRTRLMKLLYLADYESRRYLGRPISEIPYIWYNHGPFDSDIYSWLDRLKSVGIIEEHVVRAKGNKTAHVYGATGSSPQLDFLPDEVEILSYVCRQYAEVEFRELLEDIVYDTEPMVKAKAEEARGEILDMTIVNNLKAREFAIPYSEVLARIRDVRAGRFVTHRDAMAQFDRWLVDAAA